MTVSPDLIALIREIRGVASPRKRIRAMARAWRGLRRLNRNELRQLAGTLGFAGAEELLERLARGRGRVETRFLERVLEQVREPEEIGEYVDALRDPDRRQALLRRGLDAIADELEPPEAPTAEPESAGPPTGTPESPPLPPDKRRPQEPPAGERPSVPPEPEQAPRPPAAEADKTPAAPEDDSTAPTTSEAKPVALPLPRSSSPAEERVAPRPPDRAPVPVARPAPPPRQPDASATERFADLVERIRQAPTLITRLRLLDRDVDDARGQEPERLRELLELFPADWRRRRALNTLLRARIPSDLLQAMFLVEGLGSTVGERWCLATILKTWELGDDERRVLRQRHGLTPLRRRGGDAALSAELAQGEGQSPSI